MHWWTATVFAPEVSTSCLVSGSAHREAGSFRQLRPGPLGVPATNGILTGGRPGTPPGIAEPVASAGRTEASLVNLASAMAAPRDDLCLAAVMDHVP